MHCILCKLSIGSMLIHSNMGMNAAACDLLVTAT